MDLKMASRIKVTEIGEMPEDWVVTSLGDIGDFSTGKGIRRSESNSGGLPCVRYGEIYTHHHDIIRDFFSFISPKIAKTSKRLKTGDILFAATGETRAEIGKSVAFIDEIDAYAGGGIVVFSPSSDDSAYLGYALNDARTRKQKIQLGQGDIVAQIRASALSSIIVGLPPKKSEQSAIAKLLNEMDKYIYSLEKLIQKKRAVKQGVLHEVLSVRDDWNDVSLKDLVNCYRGVSFDPDKDLSNYPTPSHVALFKANNIKNTRLTFNDLVFVNKSCVRDNQLVQQNDVLVCMANGSKKLVGKAAHISENATEMSFGAFMSILRPHPNLGIDILLPYLLQTNSFRKHVDTILAGSSINNLTPSALLEFKISIPKSIAQRETIAVLLKDFDDELIVIETQLYKARLIKQGMMQKLLTGRIRLI